ncbi:MAG: DUF1385 domain-containing protein [Candidatus Melainabacteria bacterium]
MRNRSEQPEPGVPFAGANPNVDGPPRPARIGGMATPLGVYLTTGVHRGGPGMRGLMLNGALFAVVTHLIMHGYPVFFSLLYLLWPPVAALSTVHQLMLEMGFAIGLLLVLVRVTPMSALHGAEHKTIAALELGHPPAYDAVHFQPKVHRRCGTNLMALLLGVQVSLLSWWLMVPSLSIPGQLLYLCLWAGLIGRFWRPGGYWIQKYWTTREPNDAELESGLLAGREILAKFAAAPHGKLSLWRRLWAMGFIEMLTGFVATAWILSWLWP